MDNKTIGLADEFLARHTTDPALRSMLSNRDSSTSQRPTENAERGERLPGQASLPPCMGDFVVESVESTHNSRLAEEQGVARATARMHRVMEERAEQERFRREMNRRDREIREQKARERMEREARRTAESSCWMQQQEGISGLDEKITRNIICGYCGRQKYVASSRSSQTDTCFVRGMLKRGVLETCPAAEIGVFREREEWEQFGRGIERKEREIREQRARKRREREARELEEANRWPQQQEAITGPWCACRQNGGETAQGSEQDFEPVDALSKPKQET